MRRFTAPLAFLALITLAAPAAASSLPKADITRPTLGLGLGNGASLSLDAPVSGDLSLGGAIGAPAFTAGNLDLRLLYKLVRGGRQRLHLSLLGGVQFNSSRFTVLGGPEPMLGVALAYPFTSQLTGRANIVVGLGPNIGSSSMRPSGLELAYRFTPTLEGTFGWNGRGDILGLKFSL